jgi:hypothetical protein
MTVAGFQLVHFVYPAKLQGLLKGSGLQSSAAGKAQQPRVLDMEPGNAAHPYWRKIDRSAFFWGLTRWLLLVGLPNGLQRLVWRYRGFRMACGCLQTTVAAGVVRDQAGVARAGGVQRSDKKAFEDLRPGRLVEDSGLCSRHKFFRPCPCNVRQFAELHGFPRPQPCKEASEASSVRTELRRNCHDFLGWRNGVRQILQNICNSAALCRTHYCRQLIVALPNALDCVDTSSQCTQVHRQLRVEFVPARAAATAGACYHQLAQGPEVMAGQQPVQEHPGLCAHVDLQGFGLI